ncbi:MAG: MarR family transcriptional regulator [Devosia sp.]|uniref:MarR family winged helix-turn-helix transcriptional regulator n=1 Tax=Devosia sp. TaxID=1871048 RepID=UPI00260D8A88|nr:MarR family transcriptional regulator [Devosia sp.]MDB5528588.1 MarR family transcriptional regulator [Devosia sp.]
MDAWTKFAESIFAINGLLMQAGESISRPIGQSSARWQILGGLGYGPKSVAQLARDMGHARQSVQRLANVLLKEGLLTYRDKPDDRRTVLLELSPAGQAVLSAIYQRQLQWSERVTSQLDPDQLAALATTLQDIARIVAEQTDELPTEAPKPAP